MNASLIVAGDLCASGRIGFALSSPSLDSGLGDIFDVNREADFSIVNVECPLTSHSGGITKSGPRLWAPPESAQGIHAAGFTAACLANNHILDAGPAGLVQTVQACEGAGLRCVGAGEDHTSATTALTTQVRDIKLSVLAFAENEFSTTTGRNPGAWPFDLIDNSAQIGAARRTSDFVLVLLHGGAEHYPLPSPRMQKACRFFIEQGDDAVVCHHSHVIGGFEFYQDRPIVYGTGNLLFDPPDEVDSGWYTGCLVRLDVSHGTAPQMHLIPYRQDPATPSVTLIKDSERESVLRSIADLNAIIQDEERLRERWAAFCEERRFFFLGEMLCLTQPESWLLDRGLLPSTRLRLTRRRLAGLRNLFSCESHSESCEQVLRDMLEEKERH